MQNRSEHRELCALAVMSPWYDVDDATSLGWLCDEVLANRPAGEFRTSGYAAAYTTAYLRRLIATTGAEGLGFGATAEPVGR